jgi:hypothetical protein
MFNNTFGTPHAPFGVETPQFSVRLARIPAPYARASVSCIAGTARQLDAEAFAYGSGMAPQPMAMGCYFGALLFRTARLPTRLIYAQYKLCITLSEEDKTKLAENTSKTSIERKKLTAELGIVAGHQDAMLRHPVSCVKAEAELKMFANAKLTESRDNCFSVRRLGSGKRPANNSSWTLPQASSATKVQRVEQTGIPDYLAGCRCDKRLLYDVRTHESLVADLVSVFPSVSFNMFESEEFRALQAFYCHSGGLV